MTIVFFFLLACGLWQDHLLGSHQKKQFQNQSVLDDTIVLILLCNNSKPVPATLPDATTGTGTEFWASFRAREQLWLLRIYLQFSYEILKISGVGRPAGGLPGSVQCSQLAAPFSRGDCHLFIAVAPAVSPLCVILRSVTDEASYQLLNALRTRPWATVHLKKKTPKNCVWQQAKRVSSLFPTGLGSVRVTALHACFVTLLFVGCSRERRSDLYAVLNQTRYTRCISSFYQEIF